MTKIPKSTKVLKITNTLKKSANWKIQAYEKSIISAIPQLHSRSMGLDRKTPVEACGIEIEGENKWKTLIHNASRR